MCACVCPRVLQQVGTGALQILLPARKHAEPYTMGDTTPNNNAACLIHPQKRPGRHPPPSRCPQPVSRDDRWDGKDWEHLAPSPKGN